MHARDHKLVMTCPIRAHALARFQRCLPARHRGTPLAQPGQVTPWNEAARSACARVALIAVIAALAGVPGQLPTLERPLFAISGAFNIQWSERGDGEVSYNLQEAYPAEAALRALNDWLSRMGWTPLKENLWNPGLPSSNVRGWGSHVDASANPAVFVYQWVGYWRNDRGDVVSYFLRYNGSDATPGSEPQPPAFVGGVYYKAESLRLLGFKVPGA
jgi:hypothetical protein